MLVWIALTHLPTSASSWVNQPFGFVGAAEGFIFLSALFTGRIYYRLAEHDGFRTMLLKLWGRTFRLYGYHALLLAFAFLVAVPIASHGDRPGLHNLLDFYFAVGARQAITEAVLLIYLTAATRYLAHVHNLSGVHLRGDSGGEQNWMEAGFVDEHCFLGAGPMRLSQR